MAQLKLRPFKASAEQLGFLVRRCFGNSMFRKSLEHDRSQLRYIAGPERQNHVARLRRLARKLSGFVE